MCGEYTPVILQGQHTNDDEIMAKTPLDEKALGGDSSEIIMELLQRFKVRDVMKRQVISIPRNATLRDAQAILRDNHISGLPVSEGGRLYGIVSVNDIIKGLDGGWMEDSCEDHMSKNLVVLEAGMPLAFALRYFNNYTYGRFPVLDSNRKLVGIVSQRDVMRALLYELSVEIRKLERKSSPKAQAAAEQEAKENFFRKEWAVVHNDLSRAGHAANAIKGILRERKIDRTIMRRVAVAAYELEINICIHSHGGVLVLLIADNSIHITAKDRGPGIEDVEWACKDGTSTANDWIRSMGFGAGMGLSNSKRVSDKFEIASEVGKYTIVQCIFDLPKAEQPAPEGAAQ
ncbi:MAG: CBS domain-containing protein [Kiritimatiellae bacterium]|nr:CBS domain-containing protein [Kiritimatiellia bacterium]